MMKIVIMMMINSKDASNYYYEKENYHYPKEKAEKPAQKTISAPISIISVHNASHSTCKRLNYYENKTHYLKNLK
jgi:hypothetical protein